MCSCSCRAHFFIHLDMYMSLYHCVSLWKCKKIQIPWHRHFPSLWASSDNLPVFGLASLASSPWSHLLAIPERHKNNSPWISTEEKIQKNLKCNRYNFLTMTTYPIFTTGITTVSALAFARTSSVTVSFALRAERTLTTTSLWSYLTIRVRFGAF